MLIHFSLTSNSRMILFVLQILLTYTQKQNKKRLFNEQLN